MKYMIHTCNERNWYVEKYLIPSLLEQGIKEEDIINWVDIDNKGNLKSCLESFNSCKDISDGTWHLQDDVIISSNFKQLTEEHNDGIVCGFVNDVIGPDINKVGIVNVRDMWLSFPCIRIPNKLAIEFVNWFNTVAVHTDKYKERIKNNKSDDWFFRKFLKTTKYKYTNVLNLKPNIVNHIDYLLGGSVANSARKGFRMSCYWTENNLVEELERRIKNG